MEATPPKLLFKLQLKNNPEWLLLMLPTSTFCLTTRSPSLAISPMSVKTQDTAAGACSNMLMSGGMPLRNGLESQVTSPSRTLLSITSRSQIAVKTVQAMAFATTGNASATLTTLETTATSRGLLTSSSVGTSATSTEPAE